MEAGVLACIDADNGIVECESNRQKKRSLAWDHFEKLPTPSRAEGKAKCKHCETIFTATPKSGTSHLNRHVERCAKRAAIEVDPISVDFRFSDFEGSAQSVKLGKRVSKVWYEYELYPAPNMKDAKAKCKHCKIVLSAASRNGTSHLKRHLDRCIKRVSTTGIVQKYFVPSTKLTEGSNSDKLPKCGTATATSGAKHLSTSTENLAEGSKPAEEFHIDQEELQKYIAVCIINGSHPFSLVEEKSFRSMMSKACPDFKPFNRAVVRKELFSMYLKERDSVKEILAKVSSRICLAVSNWKARDTSDAYVRVAAHFVDDGWRLNRRILCFKALAPPCDDAFFADELHCLSSQYGIDCKTFAISVDEASHNKSVVTSIKRGLFTKKSPGGDSFFQVGCFANLLNNMAQSTLKLVDDILDKIRELVKYVNKSPLQRKKFYDLAERTFQLQAKRRLRLDVLLRWNSTFKLIDLTVYYKNVFTHLVESRQELSNLHLTKEEWQMLSTVHKFLKALYEVIRMFSVTNRPTANLFLKGILMVHCRIVEISKGPDSFLASAFKVMQAKLDDFWGQNSTILSCAAILDPRYKVKFVEYCHMKLHGPVHVEDRVRKVVDALYDLFSEYKQRPWSVSTPAVGSSSIDDTNYVGVNEGDLFGDYDQFLSSRSRSQGTKSELDLYLEEPSYDLNSDLDVLKFWSISSIRYPDLSEMVRDILSLPVSTVNSKEVFSAKTLSSSVQSSVIPETLQALLCLQDWLGAPAYSGDPTDTVEDPSGSSEDTECDDEDDDSVLTDSF